MFWGKNLKSNETYSLDSDKSILGADLNITNISLSDALDNVKYYIKITDNNQIYQLCSLDKNKDSLSTSLTFKVKKGMKISVKGGNRGTISFIGFCENFQPKVTEEINTDKEKKSEVIPEIKKERKESKENTKEKKEEKAKEELEEDEDNEEEEDKLGKIDDDEDDDDLDDEEMIEEDDEGEEVDEDDEEFNELVDFKGEDKKQEKKENKEEKDDKKENKENKENKEEDE
jgi:hypothetical protein